MVKKSKTTTRVIKAPLLKKTLKPKEGDKDRVGDREKNIMVKYDFWFGGISVIISLALFSIVSIIYFHNLMSLAFIEFPQSRIEFPNRGNLIESDDASSGIKGNTDTIIGLSGASDLGNASSEELLSLPEGVVSMSNLNYVYSEDGMKFAYIVESEGKAAVNLNGQLGEFFDKIIFMSFSPDGEHFAYGVKTENKEVVVIDGVMGEKFDFVFSPYFFTEDSKHFIYKGRNLTGDYLVVDNKLEGPYEQIFNPYVTKDGTNLIYYVQNGKQVLKNTLKLQ